MSFTCKYCGEKFDNPEIYRIHEDNCLEHQKQNGLLKEEKLEEEEKPGKKGSPKKADK